MAYLKHASQEYVDEAIAAESSDRATAIATAKAYLKGLIESEASRASGQEAILQQAINNIQTFEVVIAAALPTASSAYARKIYLIPSSNPKAGNAKDEYICVQTDGAWKWEQIGSTELTLEYDIEPTDGSSKIVKSGGIYAWVKNEIRVLTSWITDRLAEKQATIGDLQTIRNGASAGSTASQPGHTHAQTDVTGLSAALAGKANATALEKIGWKKRGMKDLRVSDFENYDPSDYGSCINYVVRNWTSANAALAEAFAEDPLSINYAPNMFGWFPNSNTVGAWTIAYPAQTTDPDALEVVFECTDPNGVTAQATAHIEVLAKASDIPSPTPAPVAPTPDAAAGSYAGAPETATLLMSQVRYAHNTFAFGESEKLKDRAINALTFTASSESHTFDLAAALPTATDGFVRDFLIRLVADAKVTFTTGTMDIRGDGLALEDGAADRLITLTEVASGVWYVRSIDITAQTEA